METLTALWRYPVKSIQGEEIESAIVTEQGNLSDRGYAPLHLLTTATLAHLQELYPTGDFDVRRFGPNIVIEPISERSGFVENDWLGLQCQLGEDVSLRLSDPCPPIPAYCGP